MTPYKRAGHVQRILRKHGFDPVDELVTLLRDADMDDGMRAGILLKLLPYCVPTLKAVRHAEIDGITQKETQMELFK